MKSTKRKKSLVRLFSFMVAETGLEPRDLQVILASLVAFACFARSAEEPSGFVNLRLPIFACAKHNLKKKKGNFFFSLFSILSSLEKVA
ncbi:MAG: hypothetical protein J6C23_05125 [Clostridia bacterium]|nr:hypothetical protein [Clostridia bacterium]